MKNEKQPIHSYVAKLYLQQASYDIIIYNDSDKLSFEIENFEFTGFSFDDFELKNFKKYSEEDLTLFTLNPSSHELCDCRFEIAIPIDLIQKNTEKMEQAGLKMTLVLGKSNQRGGIDKVDLSLSLELDNQIFRGNGGYFEDAFNQMLTEIAGKYRMRNCFGCQFSDYSVYGQGLFGSMLCFRNQKENYSAVKSKEEYMQLERHKEVVQEIYSCSEFEQRGKNVGYRG